MKRRRASITGKMRKKRQGRNKLWVFSCILASLAIYIFVFRVDDIRKVSAEIINPYDKIYYYEADKFDRYNTYARENPGLTPEDVVWIVNANVDKPFYSDIKEIAVEVAEVFSGSDEPLNNEINYEDEEIFTLLINKYNKLPDDYEPQNLVKLDSGRLVTDKTKEAFVLMRGDAKRLGYTINDVSAYRSISYQTGLYNRYLKGSSETAVDRYSARPGHSEHHTGRAIDICGKDGVMNKFGSSAESPWINENAYKYGFIVRYPKDTESITGYKYEPWHITYVGVKIATIDRKSVV